MLRMAFVLTLYFGGWVMAIQSPLYTLLLYLWIAYFRPEEWLWTSALFGTLSYPVGLFLLLRTAFSPPRIRFGVRTLLLCAILGQSAFSTFSSQYQTFSQPFFVDFVKSLIITYFIAVLATDAKKIRLVVMVIALSLAFEAAKQGWVQLLLNPGGQNINSVAFLGDNNLVAVGMLMLVPLLVALARTAQKPWERWLHRLLALGVLYRALSTYSRGGFVAAAVLGLIFLVRSPRKTMAIPAIVVAATITLSVLPQEYWDRMGTITVEEGQEREASSASRLYFWQVAVAMAQDRPFLGIGHNAFTQAYNRYDTLSGKWGRGRAVHSTWFGMLAELGIPGFLLFVSALGLALVTCWRARRHALSERISPELGHLATGLETALVVFAVGGTFVSFQYVEMLWHLVGLSMALNFCVEQELERSPASTPAKTVPAPAAKRRVPMSPVAVGHGARQAVLRQGPTHERSPH